MRWALVALAAAGLLAGCDDSTAPRDLRPPAAPRGLHSVTGDQEVFLSWIENTESDLAGYHVYVAPCAYGHDCPYQRVGTTSGTEFTVRALDNGVTRYFAVAAFDRVGNESELSRADVFDTPRPEGSGLVLDNAMEQPASSGYDFSGYATVAYDSPAADVYFSSTNGVNLMVAPFVDTEVQDAGYAASLDAVDYAPSAGWSPSGTAELIEGHCYVVRVDDGQEVHFGKLRVTGLTTHQVVLDWAYQVDPGNRELRAGRVGEGGARVRRPLSPGG